MDWTGTGPSIALLGLYLFFLAAAWFTALVMQRRSNSNLDPAIVQAFHRRVGGNLTICLVLAVSLLVGKTFFGAWGVEKVVLVVFFCLVSFWALREFITLTPTRRADHRTLFWMLFLFTPLQYVLVGQNLYELYTIVIPVYASLFVAARVAFTDDPKRFLERIAKIQFGLFVCVYALSHAPALLYLNLVQWRGATQLPRTDATQFVTWNGSPVGLLVFFVVLVQVSDLLHFLWDRLVGKHVIAPKINATKTWEGLIGSACCSAIFSMMIHLVMEITPFTYLGAGCMGLLVSVMASSGSMTMSAIKRDRGVHDYGTLIQGHAGVLDRIDSICFAAPIFFHVTRFFLNRPVAPPPSESATLAVTQFVHWCQQWIA